ncbi:Zn-dependent hydrolase [Bosea sp. 124]|uniref:Zn-dependent hydrolase n=1 Tax=Bosea sp. 124 TaxID=2135642 RepID=UPI000D34DE61|nr:Zn-dependent hydrolase [Bosea sp. 124]PTM42459.1 N-carbamoyl-L-amino-acid hydrolase [Bosea sp. 124]
MLPVDTDAFLQDLYELRRIGTFKTGVHRPTYSPQDMESRHWLVAKLTECRLDTAIDGIGNVYGRHRGDGPHLLVGSHIESQNEAGWLDGALGVVAGLALARAGLPVDVCAFADEEGHYSIGLPGSRSLIGDLTEDDIDRARNRTDGTPMRDALRAAGLEGLPRRQLEPGRHKGYYEMHIEQGTQLDNTGLRLGVVTGIVAIWQWRIVVEGQQDHAGGTTMAERKDAGLSAVRLLAAIDAEFPRICGQRTTWTTGRFRLDPDAPNIIPGRAEILFQFRDVSVTVLERLEAGLRALVQEANRRERCVITLTPLSKMVPALCDPAMMQALSEAAEELAPSAWQTMPSGAGHDAQVIARRIPASMLFVPSIGGISHHWTENTRDEDLALGMQVLHRAAERFLAS